MGKRWQRLLICTMFRDGKRMATSHNIRNVQERDGKQMATPLNPFTTKKFFLSDSNENLTVDLLKYSKIFLFQTKNFISHC
jgi:hypothetical protein